MTQHHTPGRDGHAPSRPRGLRSRVRAVIALAVAVVSGAVVVGVAELAPDQSTGQVERTSADLRLNWQGRSSGQQVLGGRREPGVPSVQRLRHDAIDFTVTIAPARPGRNLVRIDASYLKDGRLDPHASHEGHDGRIHRFLVGTPEQSDQGRMVVARPRPGASGLWAVVDLPEGSGTVMVSHGPTHRVPFAVDTGTTRPDTAAWSGPDGPECVTAATAAVIAGGATPSRCPSEGLSASDRKAVGALTRTLASRGVQEIAVQRDSSARSQAAYAVVRSVARQHDVRLVSPAAAPGTRDALLVLSGWADAATSLAKVSSTPLRQQPIRSDGTWLAPWLLVPGVVDSTAGAVLALDFDIRDASAQEFSQTLATFFPGQAPTSSGYVAWRTATRRPSSPLELYAASRTAIMPASSGHAAHESQVSWFPGGTVTPVGSLAELTHSRP